MKYRPDIDGIRAIAVLSVIFFHFDLSFPGGFIGVDIFFVISGFLITSIILNELNESQFTFLKFWSRRIKRILPVSVFVGVSTLILGYFILDPNTYVSLAESAFYHSFICSNFYFLDQFEDYFSLSAELHPLLHLWSLSVEEQFYLLFPIFLVFMYKKGRNYTKGILIICIISFILSVYLSVFHASVAFYSLPSRAWELAAGCIAASLIHNRGPFPSNLLIYNISFISLILSFFIIDGSCIFPGFLALIPVVSTVLLITLAPKNSLVKDLLTHRISVFIGKISYSLYLWHWPILVFKNSIFITSSGGINLACLFLTVLLSLLTYYFIENPFRYSSRLRSPKLTYLLGFSLTSLLIILPLYIYKNNGLIERFSPRFQAILSDIKPENNRFISEHINGVSIGSNNQIELDTDDFILWGDSHAAVVAPYFDNALKHLNLSGRALISPGTVPVKNVWRASFSHNKKKKYISLNQKRHKWILDSNIRNIVFVARWDGYIEGFLETEINKEDSVFSLRLTDDENMIKPSNLESYNTLHRNFSEMLGDYKNNNQVVWILLQVPSVINSKNAIEFFKYKYFHLFNCEYKNIGVSKEDYLDRRTYSYKLFNDLKVYNINIIDPIDGFFKNTEKFKLYGEKRAFYRDEDHLTYEGVKYYLGPQLDELFSIINSSKSQ
jgi:peptidoglycan/LPS O-acetylase OafA/YrhL